jgi:hypothetical protein
VTTSAQPAQQTGIRTVSRANAAIDTAAAGGTVTLPVGGRNFTCNGSVSGSADLTGRGSLTVTCTGIQPVSVSWSWSSGGSWS